MLILPLFIKLYLDQHYNMYINFNKEYVNMKINLAIIIIMVYCFDFYYLIR